MAYKRSFKKITTLVLSITALLILISRCTKETPIPDYIHEVTEENGYSVVRLNDVNYCGYTINVYTDDLHTFMQDSIKTEVIKVKGYAGSMYGIFFNGSIGSQNSLNNYCCVMVNTAGSYSVIKCINGTFYALAADLSWKNEPHSFVCLDLVPGLNKSNIIKVKIASPHYYNLYFNGKLAVSFNEAELTTGLKKGYIFDVDTQENEGFPTDTLQIKFKEIGAL